MSDLEFWTKALKEAERELETAITRTALDAAAKKLMRPKSPSGRCRSARVCSSTSNPDLELLHDPLGELARPDPSAPDRSFASFVADDESGDDRMGIINVPVMSLLAADGIELRITDARAHLNTDEADCTAIGTL